MKTLDGVRSRLFELPGAISGSRGHDATFRAACLLVRFGVSDGDAMSLLRDWNRTHCKPPWNESQLSHKLKDARRVAGCYVPAYVQGKAVQETWKITRKSPAQPRSRVAAQPGPAPPVQ